MKNSLHYISLGGGLKGTGRYESRGCYKTVHGPYNNLGTSTEALWINKAFCI
ncbi:MAG: hypothetical protein GY828_07565 [Candidatus Gracilibacteria bacterium]|nr:hypothetical protein [Candidatus Gracilibacteria bacterium]